MNAAATPAERLDARRTMLGDGLEIRRALPNRHRRTVGAWCFLDHAGPADYAAGRGVNVGYEQWIRPGQVNLMTAGRGIAHSEESPADQPGRVQLAQLWIALPAQEADRDPAFEHYPQLPAFDRGGFRMTLLAGECSGARAPARVHSPLIGLDLATPGDAWTDLPLRSDFEHAVMVLEGSAELDGARLEPGTLLYLGPGRERLPVAAGGAARILLVGGEPMREEILIWWNFVARTPAEIAQATRDWNEGRRFGEVQGARSARLIAPDVRDLRLQGGS
jgi:hypothetical protein